MTFDGYESYKDYMNAIRTAKAKKLNAIKHGAFSQMTLLPGEDPEEFEALHAALRDEWNPEGPTQEDKVFNIAQNMWRKHRSGRFCRAMAEFGKELHPRHEGVLLDFIKDVKAGKPISELKLPREVRDRLNKFYPREKYDSERAWLDTLVSGVADVEIEGAEHVHRELTKERVINHFTDADVIAKELALEERIDAKIDRDIAALGRLKTMQSMGLGRRHVVVDQPMKQVGSPPIQPESPRPESSQPESAQPELSQSEPQPKVAESEK